MRKLVAILTIIFVGCVWGCDTEDSSTAPANQENSGKWSAAEESIAVGTVEQSTTVKAHNPDNSLPEQSDQSIFIARINEARRNGSPCAPGGLSSLAWDEGLAQAALAHCRDMAANDFFSHTGSDDSSFWDRVRETDFNGIALGENISAGYDSVEAAVSGWLRSEAHCLNIMNPQATHAGYAMVVEKGTRWTYYATMVLGVK